LRWTFYADAVLAPIGLSAALAADGSIAVVVLVTAPVLLVNLLERDRSRHLTTAVAMSQAYEVVEVQARVDALTGLSNRRAWDEAVEQVQARLRGSDRGAVVVIADLDHLKDTNDSLGHDAGDALLVAAARALAGSAAPTDVVARLGGDEFGLLCECPSASVVAARDRIASALEARVRDAEPGCGVRLSLSFGARGVRAGGDVTLAIRAADEAAQAYKAARRAARL
jgi:diguanylate cyclase (GGDEF)-like protein